MCIAVYRQYYAYLGHVVNSRLTDDADIMRQTRSFYAKANNSVVRKFTLSFVVPKAFVV